MKMFCDEWEKIHSTMDWGRYPSESVVRFIARNYYKTERNKIKILDFGCGAGANTWFLAREGFDVYAFDGSPSAVKKSAYYLKMEGYPGVKFSVMDGGAIEYEENFFDCVIDNVCIYANKYEHIEIMYKNIFDKLKSGGKLYTSCFGKETTGYGTGQCLEDGTYENIETGVLSGRAIAHFFSQEELFNVLAKTGFENICIDFMRYTDRGLDVEMFIATAQKG